MIKKIFVIVVLTCFNIGLAQARCPEKLRDRTVTEVVHDHLNAFSSLDWEAYACNYSKNAYNIDDQGVLAGRDDIVASAENFLSLFNYVPLIIRQITVFRDTAKVLFSMDAGWIEIPDGVFSFRIRNGKIRAQTSHNLIKFNGPPPDPS